MLCGFIRIVCRDANDRKFHTEYVISVPGNVFSYGSEFIGLMYVVKGVMFVKKLLHKVGITCPESIGVDCDNMNAIK